MLIKNGVLIDKNNGFHMIIKDIRIENGLIKEIADELHISIRTVSFHVSNMLRKTGHKSLIGLAVEAADKGYAPGIRK